MVSSKQLRELVIQPALHSIGLWSQQAENLLVMVAAHESNGGDYVAQINGPAVGIYQMEPAAYNALWSRVLRGNIDKYVILGSKILFACHFLAKPDATEMIWNMKYASMMARAFFLPNREPIPTDIEELSRYAKKYWNTEAGKATPEKYLGAYYRMEGIKSGSPINR
jgi:hypothetical protein